MLINIKWKLVYGALLAACIIMQAMPVMASSNGTTGVTGTVPLFVYGVHSADIRHDSATIYWKTNGAATSQVFYDIKFHNNIADYAYYTPKNATHVTEHSIHLTKLSSSTTYHYRAMSVALVNGTAFTAVSEDYIFTTLATVPPSVTTIGASSIFGLVAILKGRLDDMGTASSVEVFFEWGKTTGYGAETRHQTLKHPGMFDAIIFFPPRTTYHYRAVAVGDGIVYGDDKSSGITSYTITAMAGPGGSIAPSGAVTVDSGKNKTFTITPSRGYRIANVLVDGSSVGAVSTYTFSNVTADHTIVASFARASGH